jgi:hypothetical protein
MLNKATGDSYITSNAYTNADTGHFNLVFHLAHFGITTDYDKLLDTGSDGLAMRATNTHILDNGGYSARTFVGGEDLTDMMARTIWPMPGTPHHHLLPLAALSLRRLP